MKNKLLSFVILLVIGVAGTAFVLADMNEQDHNQNQNQNKNELSLMTETADEGYQLAIQLSRKGVTSVQPDKEVLFMLRDVYAKDPDALIASSQVIAIHFQTIAAANDYWRD